MSTSKVVRARVRQRVADTGQSLMEAWWDAGCNQVAAARRLNMPKYRFDFDFNKAVGQNFQPKDLEQRLAPIYEAVESGALRLPPYLERFLENLKDTHFVLWRTKVRKPENAGGSGKYYGGFTCLTHLRRRWDKHQTKQAPTPENP